MKKLRDIVLLIFVYCIQLYNKWQKNKQKRLDHKKNAWRKTNQRETKLQVIDASLLEKVISFLILRFVVFDFAY